MKLLPIVEGPGDMSAIPILIRKILEAHERFDVNVLRPYRYGEVHNVSKNFGRFVLAAAKEKAPILWAIDCDDGCAVEWARHFEEHLPGGIDVPVKFAFFVREYESLFLAERLCLTELDIPADAVLPPDPEGVRGAKQVISRLMRYGTAYKETVHQARLTAHLDLAATRAKSRCFRHFESSILGLIGPTPSEHQQE